MPYVPTPLQAPKKYRVSPFEYIKRRNTHWTNDVNLTIQRKISQRILDKPCSTFNQKEHKGWEHPKKQIGKDSANNVQTMASSSCFSSPGKSFSQGSWADSSRRFTEFQHPIHSRLRPFRLYKKVALYLALLLYLCQPHQTRIAESGGWEVWWKCILCQLASTVFHCIAEEGFPHFPNAKPASFQDWPENTLLLGAPNPWNWHICWICWFVLLKYFEVILTYLLICLLTCSPGLLWHFICNILCCYFAFICQVLGHKFLYVLSFYLAYIWTEIFSMFTICSDKV